MCYQNTGAFAKDMAKTQMGFAEDSNGMLIAPNSPQHPNNQQAAPPPPPPPPPGTNKAVARAPSAPGTRTQRSAGHGLEIPSRFSPVFVTNGGINIPQ